PAESSCRSRKQASEPTSPLYGHPPVCVLKLWLPIGLWGGIMRKDLNKILVPSLAIVALLASGSSVAQAQARRTLPEGTVILVQTRQPLASQNVQTGQTFETQVIDTVDADGYT